jgi:pyruvate kinase
MKLRAKIIATIGPASCAEDQLRALIDAGMDVARLNFSHGTHQDHAAVIALIRSLSQRADRAIAILQDLRGPKLRTGALPDEAERELTQGETLILTTAQGSKDMSKVFVDYTSLAEEVSPGDRILLDDGSIELRVSAVESPEVRTEVVVGGTLGSNKGINLPGVKLSAPSLTEKDLIDLQFGLEHQIDFVAMSFVRSAADLHLLREAIQARMPKAEHIPLIAKLERPEAVANLEAILEAGDGVMVARGDLGVEVSPERVPSLQKHIIQRANDTHKLVITATQMLETMMDHPRPTRAEASDVANAVFDGSDALMLSGETAVGRFPTGSVETMARIISDAEAHAAEWGVHPVEGVRTTEDDAIATTHAAKMLAFDREVAAISVFTRSGRTALLMSKARPDVPILAFTPEENTYRRMALFWHVTPFLVPMSHSVEDMLENLRKACLESGVVNRGQQVVVIASLPIGEMGPPNFTLLHRID